MSLPAVLAWLPSIVSSNSGTSAALMIPPCTVPRAPAERGASFSRYLHSTAQHSHVVREVLPGSTASKRTTQQAPEPLPELQWHSRGSVAGLLLAPDQQTALMACWKPDLAGSLSSDLCSTLPQRDRPRQANSTIILQPDPDDLAANEGTILPVHCCCCIAPFPDGPHDQALTTPAVTSSKYTRDAGGKVSPLGL